MKVTNKNYRYDLRHMKYRQKRLTNSANKVWI